MAKIYLIAAEISGDFIGSRVMQSLKAEYEQEAIELQFVGIGGQLMEEAGLKTLFPMSKISLIGFFEIIPHILKLQQFIKLTVQDVIDQAPNILITIDAPGFTYRVAQKVRMTLPHLTMIHIVAPSVWAYRAGRAIKYAEIYNCLFTLLPFEVSYFTKVGLDCRYIGHPILEQKFYHDKEALRNELQIPVNEKVLCVTPGSRTAEIMRHMPIFCIALNIVAKKYQKFRVIFVLADPSHKTLIESFLTDTIFDYSFSNNKLKSFAVADVALAKSGTNTLEIAASNTPMIVAYKLNIFSFYLMRLLIKIHYISLINIIADREIIAEFIQSNCTPSLISSNLIILLSNAKKVEKQIKESHKILTQLGFKSTRSPSMVAAKIIKTEFLQ